MNSAVASRAANSAPRCSNGRPVPDRLLLRRRNMLEAGGTVTGLREAARRAERAHPRRRDLILFHYVELAFYVDRSVFGLRIYAHADDDVVFLMVYD